MFRKICFIIIILLAISCLSQSSYALAGSIRPPRMILRGEAPGNVSGFIEALNPNNVSVNVSIQLFGDIENLTDIYQGNITLRPNETKRFNFTLSAYYAGNYSGEVVFSFISAKGGSHGVALSSTIIALFGGQAAPEPADNETVEGNPDEGGSLPSDILPVLAALVIIIAIVAVAFKIIGGRS